MGSKQISGWIFILICCLGCHEHSGILLAGGPDRDAGDLPLAQCGNDCIDPGETCDGTDLGGRTCIAHGFLGGTLRCNVTCDGFDLWYCEGGVNTSSSREKA